MANISNNKRETGRKGEDIAANYLMNLGFEIEERNFRTGHLEIDIIAWDGETMVVTEVKTIWVGIAPDPVLYLTRGQFLNLTRAASAYLIQRLLTPEVRFDLVCVGLLHHPPHIRHFRDVWIATPK